MTATLATRGHAARFGPTAGQTATRRPCDVCGAMQRRFRAADGPVLCRACAPRYWDAWAALAAHRLAVLHPAGVPYGADFETRVAYDRDANRIRNAVTPADVLATIRSQETPACS